MTRTEIIAEIGKERMVETMCQAITHTSGADIDDLAQMVYVILLGYDEAKIREMWDSGQIRFFIARVIMNQYNSPRSTFHYAIRRFRSRSTELIPER